MIVSMFPPEWRCTVTVRRGGRDRKGNPLPETTHAVPGCLIGWRATRDPVDRSDMVADEAVIYADTGADLADGDRFDIPPGPWPHGDGWRVDGNVKPWPMGLEVPIARGD